MYVFDTENIEVFPIKQHNKQNYIHYTVKIGLHLTIIPVNLMYTLESKVKDGIFITAYFLQDNESDILEIQIRPYDIHPYIDDFLQVKNFSFCTPNIGIIIKNKTLPENYSLVLETTRVRIH